MTSMQQAQNKAAQMIAALEFVKLDIRSNSEFGKVANGQRRLQMWKWYTLKVIRISANWSFWIFIIYNIFF